MFTFIKNFLFIDQKTSQISHTKFWSNCGYLLLCGHFVLANLYKLETDTTLWVLFAIVVVGNRTLVKIFAMKNYKGINNG